MVLCFFFKQPFCCGNVFLAVPWRKNAVMPDFWKAFRQQVQQKAADELINVELHAVEGPALSVIFPRELHLAVFDRNYPPVGNGNSEHVAREVFQYPFRSAHGLLHVHHPVQFVQRREIFPGPVLVVNVGKEKPKGVVTHFHTAGLVVAVSKHGLEVSPKLICTGMFRVFVAKAAIIGNVPPITFACSFT